MTRTVNIPRNVDVDGNLAVVVIPKASMPDPSKPSVAILAAAEDVTYSHTTDGLNRSISQETTTDPRLALRDVLESPGKVSSSLEVTYFYGSEDDVLDKLLVEDSEVCYVIRDSVDMEEDFEVAQKADVWAVKVGRPRKNTVTGGKQTKTVKLFVQRVFEDVALVA